MSINNVVLTGRITKDVELKATKSGVDVCNFTIAVDDFNGKETTTYFIECVAWNNQARFVTNYCGKGHLIGICGRLTTRSYERKDGTKAYVTEVVCSQVQNFQQKEKEVDNPSVKEPSDFVNDNNVIDDDLPF